MKYLYRTIRVNNRIDEVIREYGLTKMAKKINVDVSYLSQCLSYKTISYAKYKKILKIIELWLMGKDEQLPKEPHYNPNY
jgi:predicted transcriptional regulator